MKTGLFKLCIVLLVYVGMMSQYATSYTHIAVCDSIEQEDDKEKPDEKSKEGKETKELETEDDALFFEAAFAYCDIFHLSNIAIIKPNFCYKPFMLSDFSSIQTPPPDCV